jgi:hypothetical protein
VPRTREVVPWAKAASQAHRNSSVETPLFRTLGEDIGKGWFGKGVMMTEAKETHAWLWQFADEVASQASGVSLPCSGGGKGRRRTTDGSGERRCRDSVNRGVTCGFRTFRW